jgi:integrase
VKTNSARAASDNAAQSDWVKTPVANLVRYKPSGIYFARVRVRGKLFRQSLKTNVLSVAKLRLGDFIKERQEELGDESAVRSGRMTIGDAVRILRQRLDGQQNIKEGAKLYRRKCIDALLASWPGLEEQPVGKVSKENCLDWARKFAAKYSPSVYNNTVGTLRMILDVAVEKGARAINPASAITKRRIQTRELHLPESNQFEVFIKHIGEAGAWCSRDCADLVRFLAYGGFRKTEAANIVWRDCDFDSRQIRVRVTKNGSPRSVPMIPDMVQLLKRLRTERPDEPPETPVMRVRECQKAMDRAAKAIGMHRITHHDLRHLFATRCIESGVDIPTVSRWLGHKDGGALAMKVYGHLRDQHSVAMAQKVTFSKAQPENVIQMPTQTTNSAK